MDARNRLPEPLSSMETHTSHRQHSPDRKLRLFIAGPMRYLFDPRTFRYLNFLWGGGVDMECLPYHDNQE